jgi:hypothetical protein
MNSWKQADVLITKKKKKEHTWKDDGTALEEKEKYLFHQ